MRWKRKVQEGVESRGGLKIENQGGEGRGAEESLWGGTRARNEACVCVCGGEMCRQGLVSGLLSDSGVNNTLGPLCVCWVGGGLLVSVSRWLRVSSAP